MPLKGSPVWDFGAEHSLLLQTLYAPGFDLPIVQNVERSSIPVQSLDRFADPFPHQRLPTFYDAVERRRLLSSVARCRSSVAPWD